MFRFLPLLVALLMIWGGAARAAEAPPAVGVLPLPTTTATTALASGTSEGGGSTECTTGSEGDSQNYMPFPAQLKHGINLPNWWEDDQSQALTKDEIHQVHNLGFDYVRLLISPTLFEQPTSDAKKKRLDQLHCDIVSLLNEGLTVIVDLHPNEYFQQALMQQPEEVAARIERVWAQVQPVLEGLPTWRIYLELCSEPMIDSATWWQIQGRIIEDLRAELPNYTFIASPGPFDGWWDMTDRTPYKDLNVVYGFYFFEPMYFTHHGFDQDNAKDQTAKVAPPAIVYPVDKLYNFNMQDPEVAKYVAQDWGQSSMRVVAENITAWRDHYNVGIVCLEFGVYRPHVDDHSRVNWLHDFHKVFSDLNVPWTLWAYHGPFGLVDKQDVPDKAMMEALVLKQNDNK